MLGKAKFCLVMLENKQCFYNKITCVNKTKNWTNYIIQVEKQVYVKRLLKERRHNQVSKMY